MKLRFLPGTVSSVPSSMGEEVTSEAREYARISAGTFQLKCIMVHYSITWGLEFLLAYVGHSVVLCIYTLFILPQCWLVTPY